MTAKSAKSNNSCFMTRFMILKSNGKTTEGVDADHNIHTFDMPAGRLISAWCLRDFSTMAGRQDAARALFHWHQKVPVLISEISQEIWFPIAGEKAAENCWLSYGSVFSFHRRSDYETLIRFINGSEAVLMCNVRTVRMQMKRCEQLTKYLNEKRQDDGFVHAADMLKRKSD